MNFIYTRLLLLSIVFSIPAICIGQQSNSGLHAEIKWDNDFLNYRFAGTDKYYTNGLFINLLMPGKKSGSLLQKLIFKDTSGLKVYKELGIYQLVFTPNNISVPYISQGDYPYIGLLSGYYSAIINNVVKSIRVTSTITAGTMGRSSLAEEGQKLIHYIIHYQLPEGWDNEVNKPYLFNYDVLLEKGFSANSSLLQVIPSVGFRAGMINTSFSAGATVQLGLAEDYFSYIKSYSLQENVSRRFRIYFTWQPKLTWVYWNGMLEPALQKAIATYKQGYQKDSAYPVVKRILFDHSFGIYLRFKKMRIGFIQNFYARELSTTGKHEAGNLVVAFEL